MNLNDKMTNEMTIEDFDNFIDLERQTARYIYSLIDNKEILYVDPLIKRVIYININGIISINVNTVSRIDDSSVIIYYVNNTNIINDANYGTSNCSCFYIAGDFQTSVLDCYIN